MCIHKFQNLMKNNLIKHVDTYYKNNYGMIINIMYNELQSFLENIEKITNNYFFIKNEKIYKNTNETDFRLTYSSLKNHSESNNTLILPDFQYPNIIIETFINCTNCINEKHEN